MRATEGSAGSGYRKNVPVCGASGAVAFRLCGVGDGVAFAAAIRSDVGAVADLMPTRVPGAVVCAVVTPVAVRPGCGRGGCSEAATGFPAALRHVFQLASAAFQQSLSLPALFFRHFAYVAVKRSSHCVAALRDFVFGDCARSADAKRNTPPSRAATVKWRDARSAPGRLLRLGAGEREGRVMVFMRFLGVRSQTR